MSTRDLSSSSDKHLWQSAVLTLQKSPWVLPDEDPLIEWKIGLINFYPRRLQWKNDPTSESTCKRELLVQNEVPIKF